MLGVAIQVGKPDEPETDLARVGRQLCGKWMPRKKTTCARRPGHGGDCATAENMENRRAYRSVHPHHEAPESRKKYNRKARIASYGLTLEDFDRLLKAQEYACGMCHEPFEEGQRIHVDHDHACCSDKCRSCGECIRGLLCHVCNIALGHIERRYALARPYLDNPPAQLVARARRAA
jgi:Recombination endonuclease VII